MFLILSIETNQPDDLMNLKVDLLGSRKLSYLQTKLSKLKMWLLIINLIIVK